MKEAKTAVAHSVTLTDLIKREQAVPRGEAIRPLNSEDYTELSYEAKRRFYILFRQMEIIKDREAINGFIDAVWEFAQTEGKKEELRQLAKEYKDLQAANRLLARQGRAATPIDPQRFAPVIEALSEVN
jgi:hypothetical protein